MYFLLIVFGATFGLLASGGLLLFYRDVVRERLIAVLHPKPARQGTFLERLRPEAASVESIIKPFQNVLPRSQAEESDLQKRLNRAGFRQPASVNVFYASRVLVPLVLALLVTVTGIYRIFPAFFYAVSIGVGFLAPDFWLSSRIKSRQNSIRLGLPEALDLMVICSEAGLGLDQTLDRVAQELSHGQKDISDELSLMLLEQRAGWPRDEALKNFADRVDIDSIRSLVATLIQADAFGTSIAKTLRVYSDTLRTQRRQRAEEQAAKTTIKLVFPLVIFIFPALFVVVLGPSLIVMHDGFVKFMMN